MDLLKYQSEFKLDDIRYGIKVRELLDSNKNPVFLCD